MDAHDSGAIARALNPLHAMIYFAPEAEERYLAAGLKPGRMGYFASRSAALGAVGPGVVAATFYNFNPALVARAMAGAWELATPTTLVAARLDAVDAALRRMLGADVLASAEMVEAAGLARAAAEAADTAGRPLAAGHADLGWPQPPHLVLWHALTILREHRGDGHIAVLVDAGLSGVEALVVHTATGTGFVVPFAQASRGWSEQQWGAAVDGLAAHGLLDGAGGLTTAGADLRRRIEDDTDRVGVDPWSALGASGAARLGEIGRRLVGALLAAGCFPEGVFARTPGN